MNEVRTTLRDDLIAAKAQYDARPFDGMWQAVARGVPVNKLAALSFLREHLPDGFNDFSDFERSHHFNRKAAFKTFDRAIASAESSS